MTIVIEKDIIEAQTRGINVAEENVTIVVTMNEEDTESEAGSIVVVTRLRVKLTVMLAKKRIILRKRLKMIIRTKSDYRFRRDTKMKQKFTIRQKS